MHDTGTLNSSNVLDVIDADEGIIHILDLQVPEDVVHGKINWNRRFENMQQHTGQHILSAVCDTIAGAATVSAHLGETSNSIDVQISSLNHDIVEKIEIEANSIVTRNLQVRIHYADDRTISKFPLRKPPKVGGEIRIIEIEGIDFSACGGTHVRQTGEVGIIKIRKWEKVKGGLTRIEFHCGIRALRDYQWKNRMINSISESLSVKDTSLSEQFEKLNSTLKVKQKTIDDLSAQLAEFETDRICEELKLESDKVKIIARVFDGRSVDSVRLLMQNILKKGKAIMVFGIKGETGNILLSCSEDIAVDLTKIFQECVKPFGGRGGGRKNLVQGGVDNPAIIDDIVKKTETYLHTIL